MADRTLRSIESVVRAKPTERDLVCPKCSRVPTLSCGQYFCECGFATGTLRDLKAVPKGGLRG